MTNIQFPATPTPDLAGLILGAPVDVDAAPAPAPTPMPMPLRRFFTLDAATNLLTFIPGERVTVQDVADVLYLINRRNLFVCPSGDAIPTALALIHDEISEANDELDAGNMNALQAELVDVLIRALDVMEGTGPGLAGSIILAGLDTEDVTLEELAGMILRSPYLSALQGVNGNIGLMAALLGMHQGVSRALRVYRRTPHDADLMPAEFLQAVGSVAFAAVGILLYTGATTAGVQDMVLQTISRNAARGPRHGGKRC